MSNKTNKILAIFFIAFILICIVLYSNEQEETNIKPISSGDINTIPIISYTLDTIPDYSEAMIHSSVIIDNNVPDFSDILSTMDMSVPFEIYTNLSSGDDRCGVAIANVCVETMPNPGETDEKSRNIVPTGWQDESGDVNNNGKEESLYNRCHLIAFSLTAEAGNKQNLITGTRYFNTTGMWKYENNIKEYIDDYTGDKTKCHVLYRVTPIFQGDNLLASGVHMEAMSVEDSGESLCFNVFVYNVQKGVTIDYNTGKKIK